MSHQTPRQEKICLNCGTYAARRYCQQCGQENLPPQESVRYFITHFINDVTHFDGKFFRTLRLLLFKPGFLAKQYMLGRRVSYLNPVRMYLFTSFLFFLIFYSSYNPRLDVNAFATKEKNESIGIKNNNLYITFSNIKYKSIAEYDSTIKTLKSKPSWLTQKIMHKQISVQQKYGENQAPFFVELLYAIIHQFPKMLFISLPLIALLLQLLYIRHKEYYYVIHGVFVIHFYIFVFIAMLVTMAISGLSSWLNWNWLSYINDGISLIILFYLYKAMRNFYCQKRSKTIFKYLLFLFSFFWVIIFIFLVFFVQVFLTV